MAAQDRLRRTVMSLCVGVAGVGAVTFIAAAPSLSVKNTIISLDGEHGRVTLTVEPGWGGKPVAITRISALPRRLSFNDAVSMSKLLTPVVSCDVEVDGGVQPKPSMFIDGTSFETRSSVALASADWLVADEPHQKVSIETFFAGQGLTSEQLMKHYLMNVKAIEIEYKYCFLPIIGPVLCGTATYGLT